MKALKHIRVEGARTHNLKNITVEIPRNELTVITGLSGSGKSSLAFDTLFAEGQRRYVESLSAYARQFLGKLDKPDVDKISGISPAIAIEQKVTSKSSRSTVGTSTEIYDYLKLLFARLGKTFSPISGQEVKYHTPQDVLKVVEKNKTDRFLFLVALDAKKIAVDKILQRGFSKLWDQDQFFDLETDPEHKWKKPYLLIDRLAAPDWTEDDQTRIIDSAQIAFKEGQGNCILLNHTQNKWHHFSNKFEADGITFEIPTVNFFSFIGACKKCGGFGSIIGVDENLVVPDKKLSIYQDAIQCWRGEKTSEWKNQVILHAKKYNLSIHKPYKDLSQSEIDMLWNGTSDFEGVQQFFQFLERESFKIQYRVMLSRYRGKTTCPECKGTRLRKDAGYVQVGGTNLPNMVLMSIGELKFNGTGTTGKLPRELCRRLPVAWTFCCMWDWNT
jgi:excinuclease ABC subunit A